MRRNAIWAKMALGLTIICAVLLVVTDDTEAGEFKLIELDEVSVNYKRLHPSGRNPLFHDSTPKEEVNLTLNTDLVRYLFWDNKIHSMTNDAQYYVVGWNLKLGIRVTSFLDIQYEHFSRHLLDDRYPHMKWPVEDSIGFNLYLYRRAAGRPSVF